MGENTKIDDEVTGIALNKIDDGSLELVSGGTYIDGKDCVTFNEKDIEYYEYSCYNCKKRFASSSKFSHCRCPHCGSCYTSYTNRFYVKNSTTLNHSNTRSSKELKSN